MSIITGDMKCEHEWVTFGSYDDITQTCMKCGKIELVESNTKIVCTHNYKMYREGNIWKLKCSNCGDIQLPEPDEPEESEVESCEIHDYKLCLHEKEPIWILKCVICGDERPSALFPLPEGYEPPKQVSGISGGLLPSCHCDYISPPIPQTWTPVANDNKGWICPLCGCGVAPTVTVCPCRIPNKFTNETSKGTPTPDFIPHFAERTPNGS